MLEARIPGVRFESRLQPVGDELPRMDIAAFVGFASTGPLHRPVAIEDPGRFREIFGPDPVLAWDSEAGRVRYGMLGTSVETFFANGGRRCWAVRVADAEAIVWHRFALPGLKDGRSDGMAGSEISARARCPGSWCENLSVATSLNRQLLPLRDFAINGDAGNEHPLHLAAHKYRLDLLADAGAFEPGELIEVFFGDDLPRLFLFVHEIEPGSGYVRLYGDSEVDGSEPTQGVFWLAAPLSPADERPSLHTISESDALAELTAAGIDTAISNWMTDGLAAAISIRRIRLEIAVWRNAGIVARIGELGLASAHPRFWGGLPADNALFGSPSLSRDRRESQRLDAEVSSPRFPLAGIEIKPKDPPVFHLPLQVASRLLPETSVSIPPQPGTALERDGLAVFHSSLFIDPELASTGGSVLVEAEHRYYVLEEDLIGLHSLLPVEEASLIAVPDVCHGGWTRQLPPAAATLEAPWLLPGSPELIELPPPDETGGYAIDWTEVAGATSYLLESAEHPDFDVAATVFAGAATATTLYPDRDCPKRIYFRVRALRFGASGPWSNTRQALVPDTLFTPCAMPVPDELRLSVENTGSPPETRLVWSALDSIAVAGARYDVQESTDADFFAPTSQRTNELELSLPGGATSETEVRRYFRVRSIVGADVGPWSNTVIVEPTQRVNWTLVAPSEFEDNVLLSVHRALLRFAGARADMLALLSLPAHYRRFEAIAHVGKLTAGGTERFSGTADAGDVLPLSDGEADVLSYGTLLHPWVTVRVPDRGVNREEITTELPPEGVIAGSMAGLSIERGAWLAPANKILQRVLALTPRFDIEDWKKLLVAGVNLILQVPRGFTLLSEVTLSPDNSLRPVHVRRLLILLRRLALREGDRFVFDVNDINLRHRVRHWFERVLADLYSRGAFAGSSPGTAYRVVTDESVNPRTSVENGRFIIELQVAPAPALDFITVRLVSDERGRLAVEGP